MEEALFQFCGPCAVWAWCFSNSLNHCASPVLCSPPPCKATAVWPLVLRTLPKLPGHFPSKTLLARLWCPGFGERSGLRACWSGSPWPQICVYSVAGPEKRSFTQFGGKAVLGKLLCKVTRRKSNCPAKFAGIRKSLGASQWLSITALIGLQPPRPEWLKCVDQQSKTRQAFAAASDCWRAIFARLMPWHIVVSFFGGTG